MLKVLILSCDVRITGGVAYLIRIISEKLSHNVEAHHLFIGSSANSVHMLGRFLKTVMDSMRLFKETRSNHYDVIHINPTLDTRSCLRDGLFMLIINIGKKYNTLVYFHGWDEKIARIILNSKTLCFLMRATFGKARKIVVLAGSFAKQLVDMGFDKDRLIISTTMFDGSIFDDVEKQSDENEIIILFMSRFEAEKGMFELLEAFYKVQIHQPLVKLHLAGDGPERATIEKKISELGLQENVKLLGYLGGKEKAQALLDADIFILPSYYPEGCPIALLEAMGAGLPIITTPVGGIPDIVSDGKNGILLTSHTPDAIEHGIEKMLENESTRKEIGELNRKTAWENYESRAVTSKIEQIYRLVAGVS